MLLQIMPTLKQTGVKAGYLEVSHHTTKAVKNGGFRKNVIGASVKFSSLGVCTHPVCGETQPSNWSEEVCCPVNSVISGNGNSRQGLFIDAWHDRGTNWPLCFRKTGLSVL